MMRFQYGLAWGLLLVLVVVTVFGSYLMPYTISPEDKVTFAHRMVDGKDQIVSPPFAPSQENWLGTDHRGYDMVSLLLNGAKYTLGFGLLITVARFAFAIVVGLYSGVSGRFRNALRVLQTITTSVPPLLLLFPALYMFNASFGLSLGLKPDDPRIMMFQIILFIMVIVVGLFPLSNQLAERAHFFNQKEFITVSRSLGASTGRIMFRHIMPHMRPELFYGFVTELVQVLFLIGQLAVLSIYVGGSEPLYLDENRMNYLLLTINGEWGAMIAYGTSYIRNYPWIIAAPALFLAVSVLILSYFSHVLQKCLEHPAFYQSEPFWKNKSRLVMVGAGSAAALLLITLVPNKSPSAVATLSLNGQSNRSVMEDVGIESRLRFAEELPVKASEFMQYLAENNWDEAENFLATSKEGEVSTPPAPYDKWLQALSSKQYQFVGTGRLTKGKSNSPNTRDPISVEVKVKNPSGQEEIWALIMPGTTRINEVKGGPGQSLR